MMSIEEMRMLLCGSDGFPMSRASFSRLYKIPIRTLENWEHGKRVPPDYVMYLLERLVMIDKDKLDCD